MELSLIVSVYIAAIFYVFILGLVKISILLFYLRLFPYEKFRYAVFAALFFVIGTTISLTFISILQCTPIQFYWNKDVQGKCLNLNSMAYLANAFTISSDFLILVLPVPVIAKLRLGLSKKLGAMLMFAIGGLYVISPVVQLPPN